MDEMITPDAFVAALQAVSDGNATPPQGITKHQYAALQAVRKSKPATFTLVRRLASTGSKLAREMTVIDFNAHLAGVIQTALRYSDWGSAANWEYQNLKEMMVLNWNFCNVASDIGYTDAIEFEKILSHAAAKFSKLGKDKTDEHLRGIAALFFIKSAEGFDFNPLNYSEFVKWAGAHHDVGRVVLLARERGTLNIETLEEVMATQAEITAGLVQGAL